MLAPKKGLVAAVIVGVVVVAHWANQHSTQLRNVHGNSNIRGSNRGDKYVCVCVIGAEPNTKSSDGHRIVPESRNASPQKRNGSFLVCNVANI